MAEEAKTEIDLQQQFSKQLEEFLWVNNVMIDHHLGNAYRLRVEGTVKPVGVTLEDGPIAVRHKILLAFECILEILDQMGAKHNDHPELRIHGDVIDTLGGDQQKFVAKGDAAFDLRASA